MLLLCLLANDGFAQEATQVPEGQVPTATATETVTDTPAALPPTPTVTSSATATLKASKKGKGKETATPTDTITVTLTETVTSTATSTSTDTPTPTVTATSTPGIFEFSVNPKPLKGGKAVVRWELTVPANQVIFKVYTSSFRLVRSRRYTRRMNPAQTALGPVETEWDVTDDRKKPLVPGTYFFYLMVKSGKQTWEARDQAVVP
jgi:hypothetical protein